MHQSPQRKSRRAHPRTVRVLGAAWGRAATGMVETRTFGSIVLINGEPRDLHSLETLTLALEDAQVDFREGEVFGRPPTPRLGEVLWNAAQSVARPKKLGPRSQLTARVPMERLFGFPLCNATRDLLRYSEGNRLPLGGLIRMDRSQRQDVLQELAALVAMGLFDTERLDKPVEARPKKPRNHHHVEAVYASTGPAPMREKESDPALVRRLRRELELVKGDDDFTLLGLSARSSQEDIQAQGNRMVRRFQKLANSSDTGEPARTLAKRMLSKVVDATERAQSGKGRRAKATELSPANALDEGRTQLEQGDFATAAKCFAVARNHEPYNSTNVAWLGWAIFNDPSREGVARRERGRKLLDEAEGLGGKGDAGFLQARADIIEGDLVRAWSRLEEVVKAHPQHAAACALLSQVKKDVKKV
jgi:hypothetical protein